MTVALGHLDFSYDPFTDTLTIESQKYSGQLFRELGGLLPEGQAFRLVKREDGVITIERLENPQIGEKQNGKH